MSPIIWEGILYWQLRYIAIQHPSIGQLKQGLLYIIDTMYWKKWLI